MSARPLTVIFSRIRLGRRVYQRILLALVLSSLLGNARNVSAAIDAEADAALNRLALLIHERPDSLERGQFVFYQTPYNLRVLFEHHVSPAAAVFQVRVRTGGTFDPNPLAMKLEVDFREANGLSLLSQENHVRLQNGQAPTTLIGTRPQPIGVVKVQPDALDYGLTNLALSRGSYPARKSELAGGSINPQIVYTTPSPQQVAENPSLAGKTIAAPAPRMVPGQGMVYPPAPRPNPPAPGSAPIPATQVELHDLPFNEMLPLGGRIKLAIAHTSSVGIEVSILGEHEVFMSSPFGGKGGTYHPSVNKFTVPKGNPVRLPGTEEKAYLIHRIPTDETGQEVRWFLLDTTLNNGMTFRLAKVTGPL